MIKYLNKNNIIIITLVVVVACIVSFKLFKKVSMTYLPITEEKQEKKQPTGLILPGAVIYKIEKGRAVPIGKLPDVYINCYLVKKLSVEGPNRKYGLRLVRTENNELFLISVVYFIDTQEENDKLIQSSP